VQGKQAIVLDRYDVDHIVACACAIDRVTAVGIPYAIVVDVDEALAVVAHAIGKGAAGRIVELFRGRRRGVGKGAIEPAAESDLGIAIERQQLVPDHRVDLASDRVGVAGCALERRVPSGLLNRPLQHGLHIERVADVEPAEQQQEEYGRNEPELGDRRTIVGSTEPTMAGSLTEGSRDHCVSLRSAISDAICLNRSISASSSAAL